MVDTYIYLVRVQGGADEAELIDDGPLALKAVGCEDGTSLLTVVTDQAGMVGLVRYLNGLGYEIISVEKKNPQADSSLFSEEDL